MIGSNIVQDRLVTVFGGAGFLGRHVVRALAQRGWRIRVASRRPDLALHTQTVGRVGQINAVQANLRYPASVAAAMRDADAVVNLVGVLSERGRQSFEAVHTSGTRAVVQAALDAGITNLTHVSAIGADPESPSVYARSKGRAEVVVREHCAAAAIVRPSIVFGPEDGFFNRFAALARISPVLPLVGGGATPFQPVYVADVADAVAALVSGGGRPGTTYEFGGPAVHSFKALMRFVCDVTGRTRLLLPVPPALMRGPAMLTELADSLLLGAFPDMLLITRDQLKLMERPNVVSAEAVVEGRTLQGLGVEPRAMESIVPTYLYRFRKAGQFDRGRTAA